MDFKRTAFLFVSVLLASATAAQQTRMQETDFRNYPYPWNNSSDTDTTTWEWDDVRKLIVWTDIPKTAVWLVRGRHQFSSRHPEVPGPSPALRFTSVTYGDLDGKKVAAVALNYTTGGTMNWDYLYVYRLGQGRLKLIGRLRSGSRAYGGLIKVGLQSGLLVLDFADPDKRTGDCCSTGYIRVRYRWVDGHFVEESPLEKGDLK